MNIYRYIDYKKFLKDHLLEQKKTYGYKSQLADAAGCQRSYFSQVLNGHQNLTPEQALNLCSFWQLEPYAKDYFINLVQLSRAGTKDLQSYYLQNMAEIRSKVEDLSKRYQQKDIASSDPAVVYYSAWYYAAIHILTTIPNFQTVPSIASRLSLPKEFIALCLSQLIEIKLVVKSGESYIATEKSIHISKGTPLNLINHCNWRNKVIQDLPFERDTDLHYSAVYSLSKADISTLKQQMLKFIDETRKLATDTNEEDIVYLCCDLTYPA